MQFAQVKVPRSNEYTYEQGLAVLSSLIGGKSTGSIIPFLRKPGTTYSLNIISIKQNIYFVVGTEPENMGHLKNQLLAQYSKADVTDLENFQSIVPVDLETANISEINLADKQYIPIKTIDAFQEVDPMASVLSAMSRSPDSNALFWLQMIIVPLDSSWQSRALRRINAIATYESPTQKMQNEATMIQEKLKYHGFKAYMRLITDSPVNTQAVTNALTVFSRPGGNSFKLQKPGFMNAAKIKQAIWDHAPSGTENILNVLELATIWHIPAGTINIPNIVWGKRLQLDAPEDLPIAYENMSEEEKKDITFIGKTTYKNNERIFGIKASDRLRHVYIVGKTGTGKSYFIDNMAIEDIRKGAGVAVLDPHGDAIDHIMDFIPKSRINDVCYFNPSDPEYAYPLNILEVSHEHQKELVVSGIIGIFHKLYGYSWGPRMEHILRNVLFTLVHDENATLPDVMKILHDKKYRTKVLEKITDPTIKQFWANEYDSMSDSFKNEAIAPILNKVGQFVTSPLIRKIIQWPKSKVDIEDLMNNRKIFLCDLSQGKLGEDNATLLGSMLITKIQIAAMNRAFQSEDDRVPFYLFVDEFQNFATSSFTKILSEARKYKLGLTLANQYITQIDEEVMGAILGNVGTIACFSVGAKDSDILFKEFGGQITPEDLTTLDRFQMIIRMMIDKVTSQPFTYYSLPLPKNKSSHREKIIEQSRKRYGIHLNK